jgi:hypothetical protein
LPKNTLYEKQGEIPQYQNYILSGFMRKFYTDTDGNEITVEINSEPRFIASYEFDGKKTCNRKFANNYGLQNIENKKG